MAAEGGSETAPLTRELLDEGWRYEFFQAVRLLQLAAPDRAPVGGDADPAREAVRFGSDVRLTFAPSDVSSIEADPDGGPPRMRVPFFGVAAPSSFGSLPLCYAELILARARHKDRALRDFLDLFDHRLISLFYRAFEQHRFPLAWERADAQDGALFEHVLFALAGLHTPGLRGRLRAADLGLLRWTGMLSRRPVSEGELADLVAGHFGVAASVESFIPAWYAVEPDELEPLGRGAARLGRDTFLGRTVCVAQSRFRLRLGPLTMERYRRFLPDGDAFGALGELVRLATGAEFDFEIQLVLREAEVPPLRLTTAGEAPNRLGWTTWLATGPLGRDADDVVVSGAASVRPRAPTH